MPQLLVTQQGSSEAQTVPCHGGEMTIGRLGTNGVVLPHESVSRHHAKILQEGEEYFLIDTGSDNGTLLNNALIQKHERYLLRGNDVITINGYHLRFARTDVLEQSFNEITDSDVIEVKLLKKVLGALDQEAVPSLEILTGTLEGKKLFLAAEQAEFTIGRTPECDLTIEEYVISRTHAKILRHEGTFVLEDLTSKNGSFVNGQRMTQQVLHDGDRIALGTIVCLFRHPREIDMAAVSAELKQRHPPAPQGPAAPLATTPRRPRAHTATHATSDDGSEGTSSATGTEAMDIIEPELVLREQAHAYPRPRARQSLWQRLSPTEVGLLWAGLVVFLVTVVLIVKIVG